MYLKELEELIAIKKIVLACETLKGSITDVMAVICTSEPFIFKDPVILEELKNTFPNPDKARLQDWRPFRQNLLEAIIKIEIRDRPRKLEVLEKGYLK